MAWSPIWSRKGSLDERDSEGRRVGEGVDEDQDGNPLPDELCADLEEELVEALCLVGDGGKACWPEILVAVDCSQPDANQKLNLRILSSKEGLRDSPREHSETILLVASPYPSCGNVRVEADRILRALAHRDVGGWGKRWRWLLREEASRAHQEAEIGPRWHGARTSYAIEETLLANAGAKETQHQQEGRCRGPVGQLRGYSGGRLKAARIRSRSARFIALKGLVSTMSEPSLRSPNTATELMPMPTARGLSMVMELS